MITVHHLNNSRSQRILWLLEELNVPYQIKFYKRDPKTLLAPKSLKAIHPLGKSPLITDGSVVVAESGAIIEYLLEKYGKGRLKPVSGTDDSSQFTYWMHYAEGSAMFPLVLSLIFSKIESTPVPFFVKPILLTISQKVKSSYIQPQIDLHFDFMESHLSQSKWFAGPQFSAADIQMSFPVEAGENHGYLKSRPKVHEFVKRIHDRPAYQRALIQGGPFEI